MEVGALDGRFFLVMNELVERGVESIQFYAVFVHELGIYMERYNSVEEEKTNSFRRN